MKWSNISFTQSSSIEHFTIIWHNILTSNTHMASQLMKLFHNALMCSSALTGSLQYSEISFSVTLINMDIIFSWLSCGCASNKNVFDFNFESVDSDSFRVLEAVSCCSAFLSVTMVLRWLLVRFLSMSVMRNN